MGTRLNAQDAGAYEALDRLLFREWDPFGIYPDGPEDEYRAYLPEFWELVRSGASEGAIAAYLEMVEREYLCHPT